MFPALEEIILGLCKSIEGPKEHRSPEERYKKIMRILIGSEEDIRKLQNDVGHPFGTYNESYCREKLYLGMAIFLKLYPNQTVKDAAAFFFDKNVVNTHGLEDNKIRELSSNYAAQYRHFEKFEERQKIYEKFKARQFAIKFHKYIRLNELQNQKEAILKKLRKNDWPI